MLNLSKILSVLVIIMFLFSITAYAAEIDMNLTSDDTTATGEIPTETDDSSSVTNTDTETIEATSSSDIGGSAVPSSVGSVAQEDMSFSNILNILVITVGVVIILLAIAILIRLK